MDTGIIGREAELDILRAAMEQAKGGAGSAVLVSGEPGIGKSRLVAEAVRLARAMGFGILPGTAGQESLRPFQVISDALAPLGGEPLFEHEESVGFSNAFILGEGGEIAEERSRGADRGLDTEAMGNVLEAVQSFVSDSFGGIGRTLGRLECGSRKIILERVGSGVLAAVFEGTEHPRMHDAVSSAARSIGGKIPAKQALDALQGSRFIVQKELEGVKLDSERVRIANDALERLKDAAEKKPALLVLEDLHWADQSSLFVIRFLARNLDFTSAMVLCTARPSEGESAERNLAAMKAEGTISELPLSGLGSDSVRGLAALMFPANSFDDGFLGRLQKDSGGNPFFVKELLRQMADDRAISRKDGVYVFSGEGYAVPPTVEDIVKRRLESLDPEAMALAEFASCIGREFGISAAESMPMAAKPGEALARLAAVGILAIRGSQGEFTHALFQAALYSGLSPRWKASHHRALGEHYEAQFPGREGAAAYELARHFGHTAEHAKSAKYNEMAGEKALAVFAAEQAAEFFSTAAKSVKALRDGEREARMLVRLGDAMFLASRYDQAAESFEAAAPMLSGHEAAAVHMKLAQTCVGRGDYTGGLAECAEGLRVTGNDASLVTAKLLNCEGGTLMRTGRYAEALERINRALDIATALGDAAEVVQTRHNLSNVYWFKGEFREALTQVEATIAERERLGDVAGLARAYNNMGVFNNDLGETAEALKWHEKSLAMKERIGDRHGMAITLGNIGVLNYHGGNLEKAKEYFERAREISRSIGDKSSLATATTNVANVLGEMNDYEGCLELFKESMAIAAEIGKKSLVSRALDGTVEPLLCLGRKEEAISNARKALAIAVETKSKPEEIASRMALGRALCVAGRLEEGEEELRETLRLAEETEEKMQIASTHYEMGMMFSLMKERESALAELAEARGMFVELRMKLWIGRCDSQLALVGTNKQMDQHI